mgnify:CR=1 FL=1
MKAYIQHQDKDGQKLILQALVPFETLRDSVLFTYRANVSELSEDKFVQYQASIEFYQRRVDSKRSNDIRDFIRKSILQERDGIQMATLFPTSLILALEADDDMAGGNRIERLSDGSCDVDIRRNVFVVDGQHRMMGMIKLYDELTQLVVRTDDDDFVLAYLKNYLFNCTILVNYDLWEQGQVFVNVNFKQKPVNKSLYYEIFGSEYSEDPTDWERNKVYLAHSMVLMLNERKESPFYQRIKMLGTGKGYISQAFVVESLMRHFKKGGLWYFDPDRKSGLDADTSYFGTELLSFFVVVKELFSAYWPKKDDTKGTLICKTTGVGAWIRLMGTLRRDDDLQLLAALKESSKEGTLCKPYMDNVRKLLQPLTKGAEKLFGERSEFKSSSGQGSESKMYKKMLALLNNPLAEDAAVDSSVDVDSVCEQIQEYLWTNPVDELDMLGHHYETEDIEGFKIIKTEDNGESLFVKTTFSIHVTIHIDNEDDAGFSMQFPAECEAVFEKNGKAIELNENSVKVTVDTDEYYQ